MAVTSVILEVQDGTGEAVLSSLAGYSNVSVYGMVKNQIVTVIEGDDMDYVNRTIQKIGTLDNIIGTYPVYAGDYE